VLHQLGAPQWAAIGQRLRRNYIPIFGALLLVWLFKNYAYPTVVTSWAEFVAHASIGFIAGEYVLGFVVLAVLGLGVLGAGGWGAEDLEPSQTITRDAIEMPARERVALIISEQGQAIATKMMADLQHNITTLPGEGMYTHQPRAVLVCTLPEQELNALKRIVREVDAAASVIVLPAAASGADLALSEDDVL